MQMYNMIVQKLGYSAHRKCRNVWPSPNWQCHFI